MKYSNVVEETQRIRRFLGIQENELIELTNVIKGRMWVGQTSTFNGHVLLLSTNNDFRGYSASYMLVNGPVNPDLASRYQQDRWETAYNGRATDKDIGTRRAIFIDVDPVRVSGISSTQAEYDATQAVAREIYDTLSQAHAKECMGFGCSGNGFYLLLALEPSLPTKESTERIQRFLNLLNLKFGNERVKIDTTVANPARLMSCPGTMKCKGVHSEERPHRMTWFECSENVQRIPLTAVVGGAP